MASLSRRTFLGAAALGTLGLLGGRAVSALPRPAPAGETLTVGYVPIACASPLLAADALGAFRRRGLNIILQRYAGWADLWSSFLTDQLHVTHMLSPMAVTPTSRPTALAYTMNTNGQALTVASRLHSQVSGLKDLRGRVIAIPFEYSIHSLLLRSELFDAGIDPTRDLELRLLRPADMVAQLEIGGIDGFIGPEPFNQRALASGSGRVLHQTREFWNRHPCCALAMGDDWRATHPEQAAAIIDALAEASTFLNAPGNHSRAASILSHEKYLNQPPTLLEPVLEGRYRTWAGAEVVDPERIHFGDATDPAALEWMRTELRRRELA